VERFGRGELSLRLNSKRKDEIGELARAFDRMAERIGTLLTAERRLLQDVSHELRSPLARMSFAAELARRNENREAAVTRIKSEIQRLSDLVASLLEVTRSEGDPLARAQETIPLADLLREIAEDCWIEADARRCRVAVDAQDSPSVAGDRELLRRAFENIVRNAIRYAPEDSRVEIRLEAAAQSVLITVRDYGVGVPDDLLDKLGQPFFRVDDSRTSSTGGIGLGLAIARRAIAVHHGSWRLENAHPGLRVTVELPLPEEECGRDRAVTRLSSAS
jgi:signal transduction histidine kinase